MFNALQILIMVNLDFWLLVVLVGILSIKLKYHWKYFAFFNERTESDTMEFLKNTESEEFGSEVQRYLFFVFPVFKREFFDTDDEPHAIRLRKRIHFLLFIWWSLATTALMLFLF